VILIYGNTSVRFTPSAPHKTFRVVSAVKRPFIGASCTAGTVAADLGDLADLWSLALARHTTVPLGEI
jgi:hypothetical protein